MSEEISARPPVLADQEKHRNKRRIWAGFITGILLAGLPFGIAALVKSNDLEVVIVPMLFNIVVVPLVAITLAIIRPTRKFGLGMLLACGLGFLVLLAICGGSAMLR